MPILERLESRARDLKADTLAIYLAARDPRTPWYATVLAGGLVAYAFSPIDLIPDFVPVFGYLDDLVLIPLGLRLVIKLIPPRVMEECRARARETLMDERPAGRIAGLVIVGVWLLVAVLCAAWLWRLFV